MAAELEILSGAGDSGRRLQASTSSATGQPRLDPIVPTEPYWKTEAPCEGWIMDGQPAPAAEGASALPTTQPSHGDGGCSTSGHKRLRSGAVAPAEHVPLPYVLPRLHHRRHRGGGDRRECYGSWSSEASDDGAVSGSGSDDGGDHRRGGCFGGPPEETLGYSTLGTPAGCISAPVHPWLAPAYPTPGMAQQMVQAAPWPTLHMHSYQRMHAEGGSPGAGAGMPCLQAVPAAAESGWGEQGEGFESTGWSCRQRRVRRRRWAEELQGVAGRTLGRWWTGRCSTSAGAEHWTCDGQLPSS